METIRIIDLEKTNLNQFSVHLADCVVLTKNNKILMQQRPENWGKHAGVLNIFGGHVEDGEKVMDALIRELNEELGAIVKSQDVTFVGALTEDFTNHKEVVHVHFWHDKEGTITGCYEAEAVEYDNIENALQHPKIMDYAFWALKECEARGFLVSESLPSIA